MSAENLDVSDHAIVRFLERVQGVDIKWIKEQIATEKVKKQFAVLETNGVYSEEKFRVRIVDGIIVTVLT